MRIPLAADILVSGLRIGGNKLAHHFDAFRQIEVDHFYSVAPHEFRTARQSAGFAHDHLRNSEPHDCATAEIARHQG